MTRPDAFEGVREVEGIVDDNDAGGHNRAQRLLARTALRCQTGGAWHDALECAACPRFVNYLPAPDLSRVRIRCQWTPDDPVTHLMTLAPAIVAAPPDLAVDAADDFAQRHDVHQLVVADGDCALGIACRCELARPALAGERVSDRMRRPIPTVAVTAPLAEVAREMRRQRARCLLVVAGADVRGVITRGDLRRAGADPSLLGPPPTCAPA